MKKYLFFIFILSIIFFTLDLRTNKYFKNINEKPLFDKYIILCLSFIHNFIFYYTAFLLFYILSNDVSNEFLILHLLVFIFTMLHWNFFDGNCIITIIQNNLLGIPKNSGFRDIYDIIFDTYSFNVDNITKNKRVYIYRSTLIILIISILTILYNKNF
tara:strand:+ start:1110 stop:1583 length:474 start_codon:yes stop_codon:yes gene_type:complete